MYNTETQQQGEWVTVEGVEFLEVKGGAYIKKSDVGDEWIEFDSQTVNVLEDLIQKVKSGDKDTHFLLVDSGDEGGHVLGYRISDMIMLSSIDTLVEQFTQGDPLNTMLLMSVLKKTLMGDDD